MGALSGSLSVAKFWVQGDLPKDPRRAFADRIRLRRFQPLSPDEDVEERYGWCALAQPTDLELSVGKVFQNEYIVLGFRWDRYRFPASLVNAQLQEAMTQLQARRGDEALSRSRKAQLKQQVLARLKRKYFPQMRMVDLVWHVDRGIVYFWSHSKGIQERMCANFEVTFGVELVLNSPYVAAQHALPDDKSLRALQQLEMEAFHGPG